MKTISILTIIILLAAFSCKKEDEIFITQEDTSDLPGTHIVTIKNGSLIFKYDNGDEEPFTIKGTCWAPSKIGDSYSLNGENFIDTANAELISNDIQLMKEANCNSVRTYAFPHIEIEKGRELLDSLHNNGIYIIMTVFIGYNDDKHDAMVNAYKDHPAVLMWLLANEFNYNNLYTSNKTIDECVIKLNEVISEIKTLDTTHPIGVTWAWDNNLTSLAKLGEVNADIYGFQSYMGKSFGNLIEQYQSVLDKPFFYSEYGCDSYNGDALGNGTEDEDAQAVGVRELTLELKNSLNSTNSTSPVQGGCILDWADIWWKAMNGNNTLQDSTGADPGGGPYPDYVFHEEWFGIVDINRIPKKAYYEVQEIFGSIE